MRRFSDNTSRLQPARIWSTVLLNQSNPQRRRHSMPWKLFGRSGLRVLPNSDSRALLLQSLLSSDARQHAAHRTKRRLQILRSKLPRSPAGKWHLHPQRALGTHQSGFWTQANCGGPAKFKRDDAYGPIPDYIPNNAAGSAISSACDCIIHKPSPPATVTRGVLVTRTGRQTVCWPFHSIGSFSC